MRLITAHKILICSAVVFFLYFALVELANYRASGSVGALGSALFGVVIAVAFAAYFRTIKPRPDSGDR